MSRLHLLVAGDTDFVTRRTYQRDPKSRERGQVRADGLSWSPSGARGEPIVDWGLSLDTSARSENVARDGPEPFVPARIRTGRSHVVVGVCAAGLLRRRDRKLDRCDRAEVGESLGEQDGDSLIAQTVIDDIHKGWVGAFTHASRWYWSTGWYAARLTY